VRGCTGGSPIYCLCMRSLSRIVGGKERTRKRRKNASPLYPLPPLSPAYDLRYPREASLTGKKGPGRSGDVEVWNRSEQNQLNILGTFKPSALISIELSVMLPNQMTQTPHTLTCIDMQGISHHCSLQLAACRVYCWALGELDGGNPKPPPPPFEESHSECQYIGHGVPTWF